MKNLSTLLKGIVICVSMAFIVGCDGVGFNPFQGDSSNQFMVINSDSDTSTCNIGFGIAISRPLNDSLLLSYIGDSAITQILANMEDDSLMATAIILSSLEFDENTDLMTIILLDQDQLNSGSYSCLALEQTIVPNFVLPENSFFGYMKVNENSLVMHNATVTIAEDAGSYEININDGTTITGEQFTCHYKGLLPLIAE